jgi:uncharacterized membrane protein YuzA (DUF378 family)
VTLHVATGVLVGLAVNRALAGTSATVRYITSLLAGAVYLLGHNLFWANVTLKENALAAFLYVLAIFCLLRALSAAHQRSIRADVWLGTIVGCLLLARLLPSSVLAVAVTLGVLWALVSRRSAIAVTVAMLVPLLLWGLYAEMAFGHILPTSMHVKTDGRGILSAVQHWWSLPAADLFYWSEWYGRWVISFLSDRYVDPRLFSIRAGFVGIGVGSLMLCMVSPAWWSRGRTLLILLAAASLCGVLAIPVLLYRSTKMLLTYSTWYLFDVSAILVITCAVAIGFVGQRVADLLTRWASPRPAVSAIVIGLLWMGAVVAELKWFNDVKPLTRSDYSESNWQYVAAKTTLWFRSAVPLEEGERVGAFNAGLVGLLLPHGLINLDGLANDDIGEYLAHGGELGEYMLREGIRYVIDFVPRPADLERLLQLKTEVLMTSEAKLRDGPDCPKCGGLAYYVIRLQKP